MALILRLDPSPAVGLWVVDDVQIIQPHHFHNKARFSLEKTR